MIKTIRENIKKIFVVGIVLMLAAIMAVAFTPNLGKTRQQHVLAEVGKYKVKPAELSLEMRELMRLYNIQKLPKQYQEQFRMMARRKVENKYLIALFAEERGIQPTFDQLMDFIQKQFRINGRFNRNFYENTRKQYEHMGVDFDLEMKMRYIQQFIIDLVTNSLIVGQQELKEYFRLADHKVTVDYFIVNFNDIRKNTYPQSRLETYYRNHKNDYVLNSDMYRPAQIFLKEDTEDVYKLLQRIQDNLNEEKRPFKAVARQYSQDRETKEQGGDMGWIVPAKQPKPIASALEKMEKGQVSSVIRTEKGYHILKLNEVMKRGEAKPLDMVKPDIISTLNMSAVQNARKTFLQKLKGRVRNNNFSKMAKRYKKSHNAVVNEAMTLSRDEQLFQLQGSQRFKELVFDSNLPMKSNRAALIRDGVVVFRKTGETRFDPDKFEKQKTQKREEYIRQHRNYYLEQWLTQLRKRYNVTWYMESS